MSTNLFDIDNNVGNEEQQLYETDIDAERTDNISELEKFNNKVFLWPLIIEKEIQKENRRLQKQKRIEEKKATIKRDLENAKNPEIYETFIGSLANFDNNIQTFCARRKGRSHIGNNMPCQDYCLKDDSETYCLLTVADGVGSCQFSDSASKYACEIIAKCLKGLEGTIQSESEFIKCVHDIEFRKHFISEWKNAIVDDWKSRNGAIDFSKISQKEILKNYGTTLMFILLTKNWITAGNIGDGQILVFNNIDWEVVRFHSGKFDSKTTALSNQKCYIENFKIKSFKRDYYTGILLSTDGIYDVLSAGSTFYNFAKEIANRFDSKKIPYLPFCRTNEENTLEDISQTYTQDDCTIAMALDSGYYNNVPEYFLDKLLNYFGFDGARLFCRNEEMSVYNAVKSNQQILVAFVNEKEKVSLDSELVLEHAKFLKYRELLIPDRVNCQTFLALIHEDSVEGMWNIDNLFDLGYLMEKSEQKKTNEFTGFTYGTNTSEDVLKLFCKVKLLEYELKTNGLCFNSLAPYLLFMDKNGNLHIDILAIRKIDQSKDNSTKNNVILRYFENLIGVLRFKNKFRPVFLVGYLSKGQVVKRLECDNDGEYKNMFYLAYNFDKKAYYICNCSNYSWNKIDNEENTIILENEKVLLKDGLRFRINDDLGDDSYYEYYSLNRFVQNTDLLRGVLV